MAPLPSGTYCKIPKDYQGNVVRGARNYPCADVPGKRAATPKECRSNEPYVPLGTNPWYGDPNQILNCPAPAARCDQPVKPGLRDPGAVVNNGMNPLPADQLPPPRATAPTSDPLSPPGQGTVHVQWTTAQPVHVHSGTRCDCRLQPAERRGGRARRRQVLRQQLE